jgi:hypothetical protein
MEELIHIHNQGSELRADSRDVAKLFGIEHESFRKLVEKHKDKIEGLGFFRFEIGKIKPNTKGRPEKFIFLNFYQIAFLLSSSKPREDTVDYKFRLMLLFQTAQNKLRPIDHALLSVPEEWNRTFPRELYEALLKIYGAKFEKIGDTPSWVGKWTNKFIYEALYKNLPDELKQRRAWHDEQTDTTGWKKLHQFIEKHAKKNLETHLIKVTALLQASSSPADFFDLFAKVFWGQEQLLLIPRKVRDEFS